MTVTPNPEMDFELYMDTAVLAGQIMLESNAETYRVEDTVTRILKKTGLQMTEALALNHRARRYARQSEYARDHGRQTDHGTYDEPESGVPRQCRFEEFRRRQIDDPRGLRCAAEHRRNPIQRTPEKLCADRLHPIVHLFDGRDLL